MESAVEAAGGLRLSLSFVVGADTQQPARAKAYRPLVWRDVQALAADEGIELALGQARVDLLLPQK